MRLVVLGPGHPFRGGIALTTTRLVQSLRQRGHQVTFLTPIRQYPRWLYPGADDRDPDACPRLEDSHACLDPLSPTRWSGARRQCLRSDADAWILPYWTWAWAGLWWFLLRTERRPKVAAVVHNLSDHEGSALRRLAARAVLSRCQGLFTHAGSLASALGALYPGVPIAAHPLPPVPLGEPPDREGARAALGLTSGRLALFAGLIRPYKGVELLLEAMALLPRDSGWQLVVAGEPWEGLGEKLRQRVAQPDLAGRVRLDLRWLPDPELSRLLAAADLVVLPYHAGSQSAMAPLALSYGVPVLSTRVGGLAEVIRDGINGLLVEPGSAPALAAAIASLDGPRLQELSDGARSTVAELTWSAYAAELEGLLARM